MPRSLRIIVLAVASFVAAGDVAGQIRRPNILLAISDDQSWVHAGAYGNKSVKTPAFDRVASEGVLFTHAFCSAPSCTPSRAALLTGQDFWRLEQGANLLGTLPKKFAVYPDLLEATNYYIGYTGKGWAPGDFRAGGRARNPAGPLFNHRQVGYGAAFREFLKSRPPDKPFCFWFGSSDPHRKYDKGSGERSGNNLDAIAVPPFLPDVREVRSDIADYLFEIERFDRHLGEMLQALEDGGELDNTLVVVTSDNGMPFPRAKTNLYDYGTRMPLAIRWPKEIPTDRVVSDFVNLTDLAPTFLEVAGVEIPSAMTGRSLLSVLRLKKSGVVDPQRDEVVVGRERHGWNREPNVGYPCRAIRTRDYLYVRNFKPDRIPGYDTDRGPTFDYLIQHAGEEGVRQLYQLYGQCHHNDRDHSQ